VSGEQNAGQYLNMKTGSNSSETVEQFKHSGNPLTNPNYIREEFKNRLKSANTCCHSVSSSLLYKSIKNKIYRTIILPVALYGCETWSLTLREEHRLRVFENRVLRRIFGPTRDGVAGECRGLHNEELNDMYCSPNIIRMIK
jgi:hypothetical protein